MKCSRVLSVLVSVCMFGCSVPVFAADVNNDAELSLGDAVVSDNNVVSEDDVDYILGRPMSDMEVADQESMVPDLVDLPEPDGPIMARNSPFFTVKDTSFKALTWFSPEP